MKKTRAFGCRSRTKYTDKQVEILEGAFQENHYPDTTTLENLAYASDVGMDKVNVWFQNRRSKFKKQYKGKHMSWMRSQIFEHAPETETRHVLSPPGENTPWRHSSNPYYSPLELSDLDLSIGLLCGNRNSPLCPPSKSSITTLRTGRNPSSQALHLGATWSRHEPWGGRNENTPSGDRISHELYLPASMLDVPLPSDDQLLRHVNRRKPSNNHDLSRTSTNPLTLGHLTNDFPAVSQAAKQASDWEMPCSYASAPLLQRYADTNVSGQGESLQLHPVRYSSLDTGNYRSRKTSGRCQVFPPVISSMALSDPAQYRHDNPPRCSTPLTCPNVGIMYDPFFIR